MSRYIKLDDAIGIITEQQGIRGDTFKALHNAYAVDIVRCSECKHYEAKEDCWVLGPNCLPLTYIYRASANYMCEQLQKNNPKCKYYVVRYD